MSLPAIYLASLLVTIGAECLVARMLMRPLRLWQANAADLTGAILSANLISHPLAWLVLSRSNGSWLGIELAVVLFEVLVLRYLMDVSWRQAAALGLAANLLTAWLGAVCMF